MFGFGFFASFGQLMYAHIKDLMPGEMAGTAMGGVNFFVFAGAGVFLQGLGSVMGHAGGVPGNGSRLCLRLYVLLCRLRFGPGHLFLEPGFRRARTTGAAGKRSWFKKGRK